MAGPWERYQAQEEEPPAGPWSRYQAPAEEAPRPSRRQPTRQEAERVARLAAERQLVRNMVPGGVGYITQPFVNMLSDPARRDALGQSAAGFARDVRQIPNLDAGQLLRDTWEAGSRGVRDLPQTLGNIAAHLPEMARGVTYGPLVDEERAQQELDAARAAGDSAAMRAAAQEANTQTGAAATNVAGFGLGSGVRTPLQAAGLALALDAPHALSRNSDLPLQERLPGALTEMAGSGLAGGVLQQGANMLSGFARTPPRTGDMVNRMERAGIDPSLAAANGGGISGTMTKAIGDNLAAGPLVRARVERQLTQARDAAHRIATEYGQPRDLQGAGSVVRRATERFARDRAAPNPQPGADPMSVPTNEWSFAAKAGAVFDHALEPVLENTAELGSTLQVLNDLQRRADSPLVRDFHADATLRELDRTVRRLARNGRDSHTPQAATADDVAAAVADIENARRNVSNGEQSLATWVRRRGGISDDRGDIFGRNPAGRGASAMLSRNGRTIDDLANNAWEDGFFPGDTPPSAREFLDALEGDIRAPGSVRRANAGGYSAADDARQVLNYYEGLGIDTARRGRALESQLTRSLGVDEAAGQRPVTLRDLRELRRKVRLAQESPALSQSVDNASLQRLEAALTEDIYRAAGDAAPNLQRADRWYRRGRGRINDVLSDFFEADPGRAIPRILQLARPDGNARSIAVLRQSMKPDEWRTVAASIIDHMGQPTAGSADVGARIGFSVQRFATAYRAMSPQARRAIFGARGGPRGAGARRLNDLADELDNLARVAQNLKGVEARANFSGSASHIQTGAFSALGLANLPALIGTIAAMGLMGEVLTNRAFVRWLTSAPKRGATPAGMRQAIASLGQLAARDPALAPVYAALADAQGPRSSASAYADDTQRRGLPRR